MAIPVWTPGQVLAAADVNRWFVPLIARKSSDTTRTSTTTVSNDPHLVAAVEANSVYVFQLVVMYRAADAGDLKVVLTGPASTVINSVIHCTDTTASTNNIGFTALTTRNGALPTSALIMGGCGALDIGFTWAGSIDTAGTAGNFTVQWAQGTLNATGTILYTGSHLMLTKCG